MSKTNNRRTNRATKKMRPMRVKKALRTWRSLMGSITKMTEQELLDALQLEVKKPKDERREDIIVRLHRKYCWKRQERELQEYLA